MPIVEEDVDVPGIEGRVLQITSLGGNAIEIVWNRRHFLSSRGLYRCR